MGAGGGFGVMFGFRGESGLGEEVGLVSSDMVGVVVGCLSGEREGLRGGMGGRVVVVLILGEGEVRSLIWCMTS